MGPGRDRTCDSCICSRTRYRLRYGVGYWCTLLNIVQQRDVDVFIFHFYLHIHVIELFALCSGGNLNIHIKTFCGFSMGRNQYWAGRVYDLCVYYMTGTPEGSTESGFMEKPGIEPATPGLQGIALIHYTTRTSIWAWFVYFIC